MLIVDNDKNWCSELREFLVAYPQFDVMKPAYSGDKAIELIETYRPDAIVLDLLLSGYDGLYIIDNIESSMPSYRPAIYVVSVFSSQIITRLLHNCVIVGAYNVKPVHPKFVANILGVLLTNDSNYQVKKGGALSIVSTENFHGNPPAGLDAIVEDYLQKLGIGNVMTQTKCVRAAIEICIRADKNSRIHMMELYKLTGETFSPPMTVSAVERNIRSAVQKIKNKRSPLFEKYFPVASASVNNSIFVQESANMLRRWIMENSNGAILSEQKQHTRARKAITPKILR